jgi:PiT family inorganic phosphate transporter
MIIVLLFVVALLAFANGSNDNGKGVASMVGFGVARPAHAMAWATFTTLLGAAFSFWAARGLLKGFSTDLFTKGTPLSPSLYISILIGACAWVLFATRTGLPVSTTHAIIGALTGAGLVAYGSTKMEWAFLRHKFAIPLAVSPVLSLAIVYILAWPVVWIVGKVAGKCVCIVEEALAPAAAAPAVAMQQTTTSHIVVENEIDCAPSETVATTTATVTAIHWISSGLISFVRGWNDTPKIAALSVIGFAKLPHGIAIGFATTAIAMAIGGLVAGRRVLETLSKKVTPLPMAESLTASIVTAVLVGTASWSALPVSTTHVATGAIIGAGLKNNPQSVKWGKVGEILLSWCITLPVAALIAAGAKYLIH